MKRYGRFIVVFSHARCSFSCRDFQKMCPIFFPKLNFTFFFSVPWTSLFFFSVPLSFVSVLIICWIFLFLFLFLHLLAVTIVAMCPNNGVNWFIFFLLYFLVLRVQSFKCFWFTFTQVHFPHIHKYLTRLTHTKWNCSLAVNSLLLCYLLVFNLLLLCKVQIKHVVFSNTRIKWTIQRDLLLWIHVIFSETHTQSGSHTTHRQTNQWSALMEKNINYASQSILSCLKEKEHTFNLVIIIIILIYLFFFNEPGEISEPFFITFIPFISRSLFHIFW